MTKRNSRYFQRCDDCCPICKHQCGLRNRHKAQLHECPRHVWGQKATTRKNGFDYPEIDNDSHEQENAET